MKEFKATATKTIEFNYDVAELLLRDDFCVLVKDNDHYKMIFTNGDVFIINQLTN